MCVQAFPGIAPERLARSGPGWHRWTRRNAGTTMVPVAGRPAARGTWHVPPRKGLPKISRAPGGQTGSVTEPKLTGHRRTVRAPAGRPACLHCAVQRLGGGAVSWELTSARGALSARLGSVTPDSLLQTTPPQGISRCLLRLGGSGGLPSPAATRPGRDARCHRRESSLRDTARGRSYSALRQ